MTTLGQRLIQSIKEARAIARGEMEPTRVVLPDDTAERSKPKIARQAARKRHRASPSD